MQALIDADVSASDRFGFALFMAVCFHLLLLFGISFSLPDDHTVTHQIDVLLARDISSEAPEKADFVGQANQQGGGKAAQPEKESSPVSAPFPAESIAQQQQQLQRSQAVAQADKWIHKSGDDTVADEASPDPAKASDGSPLATDAAALRATMMASLEAELDEARRASASQPTRKVVSAATAQASEAAYIHAWQRKVERIGTLNYPAEARARNLYGKLTLKVSIRADGSLEKVQLLESSGIPMLDLAARKIVHLAAPFAPLPPEIRRETDVLEIVRIWRFEPGNRFSSRQ